MSRTGHRPPAGRRRRAPRLYLHLGCLGCSVPLLAVLAALIAAAVTP